MNKLPEIHSIKPCNPNKLVRENRDKINEIVAFLSTLKHDIQTLYRAIETGRRIEN